MPNRSLSNEGDRKAARKHQASFRFKGTTISFSYKNEMVHHNPILSLIERAGLQGMDQASSRVEARCGEVSMLAIS